MTKTLFFTLVLIISLTTVGCINIGVKEEVQPIANEDQDVNQEMSNKNGNVEPRKFYPDNNQLEKPEPVGTGGSEFVITQELEIKFYLVEKYNPGVCYGLPGSVSQEVTGGMISRNPELAQLIKGKYNLTSDLDIYNKIKQLNGIMLTKMAGGKYQFNFTDGQCCILTAYEGEVDIVGKTISDQIIREETKQNPC